MLLLVNVDDYVSLRLFRARDIMPSSNQDGDILPLQRVPISADVLQDLAR